MKRRWWSWSVVLFALTLGEWAALRPSHLGHAVTTALVLVAIGVHEHSPRTSAALAVVGGVIGYVLLDKELLAACIAGLVGIALLIRERVPTAVVAAVGAGAVAAVPAEHLLLGRPGTEQWLAEALVAGALTVAVGALALSRRARRDAAAAVARARAREIAGERQDAVLAERARIARELHDLVAHSVSVIAALAESAPYTVADLPPPARERFGEIAGSARGALGDLRDLLAVLRRDQEAAGFGPQAVPDIRGIERLAAEHRSAGGTVALHRTGDLDGLPVPVEVAAHRIVQEALTNVRRHTANAPTTIEIARDAQVLRIAVADTGPPRTGGAGSGHGLVGMRERVETLRGSFEAGPVGAGFRVRVELPVVLSGEPAADDPSGRPEPVGERT